MNRLLRACLFLLFLLSLFVTSMVILTRSESVARYVLYSLDSWTGGIVRVSGFSGRLIGGFSLKRFSVDYEDVQVRINDISVDTSLDSDFTLVLSNGSVGSVYFELLDMDVPSSPLPYIDIPLNIDIRDTSLNKLNVVVYDIPIFVGEKLTGSGGLSGTEISYRDITMVRGPEEFHVSGHFNMEGIYETDSKFKIISQRTVPITIIEGELSESITAPKINVALAGWANGRAVIDTNVFDHLDKLPITADITTGELSGVQGYDFGELNNGAITSFSLEALYRDDMLDVALDSKIALPDYSQEGITIDFLGQVAETQITIDGLKLSGSMLPGNEVATQIEGDFDYASQVMDLRAQLFINDQSLSDAGVSLQDSLFLIDGSLNNFEVDSYVNIQLSPDQSLIFKGTIIAAENQVELDQGIITGGLLNATVNSLLTLGDTPELTANMAFNGLDLDLVHSELSSNLAGKLELVAGYSPELSVQLALSDFSGQVATQELSGKAELGYLNDCINISDFRFESGADYLRVGGSSCANRALDVALRVEDLARWNRANLAGNIKVNGTVSVTPEELLASKFELDAEAENIRLGKDYALAKGKLQMNGSLGEKNESLNVMTRLHQVELSGRNLGSIDLDLHGTSKEHQLSFKQQGVIAPFSEVALQGVGGIEGDQYRLALRQFNLSANERWSLQNEAVLEVGSQSYRLDGFCINSRSRRALCSSVKLSNGELKQLDLDIVNLPINWAAPIVPELIIAENTISGTANWVNEDSRNASSEFSLEGDGLRLKLANGIVEDVPLSSIKLSTALAGESVKADSLIRFGDGNSISLTGQVENAFSLPRYNLTGDVALNHFHWLGSKLAQVDDFQANLMGNLSVRGEGLSPLLSADFQLRDSGFVVTSTQTFVEKLHADMSLSENGILDLTGGANIGGPLTFSGHLDVPRKLLDVEFKGDQLELANSQDLKLLVSTNVSASLADNKLKISGSSSLHRGEYQVEITETRLTQSDDIIFVDKRQEEGDSFLDKYQLALDLTAEIAPGFALSSDDFYAELEGKINIEKGFDGPVRTFGTIEAKEGRYRVYGTQMPIVMARVNYSGGTIDNPNIDAKVEKKVDDVIVGVNIKGTLNTPSIELYSNPFMTDSARLSYLIFETPPSEDTAAQIAFLQASEMLGTGKKMSNALGKTTVSFTGAKAQIGRHLNRYFWVGINYDMTDNEESSSTETDSERSAEFVVRYRYNHNFSVESSAGQEQSVDAYYSFDFSDHPAAKEPEETED